MKKKRNTKLWKQKPSTPIFQKLVPKNDLNISHYLSNHLCNSLNSTHSKLVCKAEDSSQQSKGSKILNPPVHSLLRFASAVALEIQNSANVVHQSSYRSCNREPDTSKDEHRIKRYQIFKRVLVSTLNTVELIGVLVGGVSVKSRVRDIESFTGFHYTSGHVAMLQEKGRK